MFVSTIYSNNVHVTNEKAVEEKHRELCILPNIPNDDTLWALYEDRINLFEIQIAEIPTINNHILKSKCIENIKEKTLYDMKSCYPMCHGAVLLYINDFLKFKKQFGSKTEKKIYGSKTFTTIDFLDRIATKRAVYFLNDYDSYQLRLARVCGSGGWDIVGSDNESETQQPKLDSYLSYDEIMISAMCGISSHTRFINKGSRNNCGDLAKQNTFINNGFYIGLIGARLEKSGYMEHSLITINKSHTNVTRGYGVIRNEDLVDKEIEDGAIKSENKDNKGDTEDKENDKVDETEVKQSNTSNTSASNASNTAQLETEKNAESKDDEKEISLSQFEIKCKMIDNYCKFYGNVEFIPTYNELTKLYAKKGQIEKENGDKDKNTNELSDYLQKRFVCSESFLSGKTYLDIFMYKIRIRISLELFLFDSDLRTKNDANHKLAYCHVVGLGLGVWTLDGFLKHQTRIFIEAVKDIIRETNLPHIGAIDFSFFDSSAPYTTSHNGGYDKQTVFEIDNEYKINNDDNDNDDNQNIDNNNESRSNNINNGHKNDQFNFTHNDSNDHNDNNDNNDKIENESDRYSSNMGNDLSDGFENKIDIDIDNGDSDEENQVSERYYCYDASNEHKIDIFFSNRNPCDLLKEKYSDYKLCAMYAWDGNALPGNEYYMGSLAASGDPAAASCSTIPFVQNFMINKEFVNGNNTKIYFRDPNNKCNYIAKNLKELHDNVDEKQWMQWAQNSRFYDKTLPAIDITKYLS